MPGLASRRALRVAALALPAAVATTLLTLPADATTAPAETTPTTPTTPTPAAAAPTSPTVVIKPKFTELPLRKAPATSGKATARAAAAPAKLQTFTRSFRYGRTDYRYTMVGYPTGDTKTAALANTITPISFRFTGGTVKTPSSSVLKAVTNSGLYKPMAFPGGKGQYGDVFMRTQFWLDIRAGKRAWHVVMRAPKIKSTLKLTVPADKGGVARIASGPVHLVDIGWFDAQVQRAIAAGSPAELTQFLGGDVVLCGRYDPADLDSCGIGGYHSAIEGADRGVRTYSYQSYLSATIFGTRSGFYGLAPMSHELAEWLANPYVTNKVPAWTEKTNPQYGCSDELEVGDPLVGRVLRVNKQAYQDEAYLSYFARQKPSRAWAGRYTWFNSFKTYSSRC